MDREDLVREFEDRHLRHLVYDGPYRLRTRAAATAELRRLQGLFEDWRQRVYRFETRRGASVVLYTPLGSGRLRWDFVPTEFWGADPFAFRYADGVTRDLPWSAVQRLLDRLAAAG